MATRTSRSPKRSTMARSIMTAALSKRAGELGRRGEEHLMAAPQVEPEGLGPLDQTGDVGVTAEQIVDELPPRGLLLADHLPSGSLVPLDQHLDGIVDHAQHGLGCARTFSRSRGVRRIFGMSCHIRHAAERYRSTAWLASTPCSAARRPSRRTATSSLLRRPTPRQCGVGQDDQVLTEQFDRGAGIGSRRFGHHGQPVVQPFNSPQAAATRRPSVTPVGPSVDR